MATFTTTPTDHSVLEDQIRGLIYGQAIGDAIGLLSEFMIKEEAQRYYGDKGELEFHMKVPDMHRSRWKTGDWTDDTDQMILIMLSILDQDGKVSPTDFGAKLKKWSKEGFPELGDFAGMGIGSTTLHVLRHEKYDTNPHDAAFDIWERSGRFVAPNGAIMRTSILGAYRYQSLDRVQQHALDICKVTHADPRCQASVVAMTTAISLMLNGSYSKNDGQDVAMITKEAYKTAKEILPKKSSHKELKKHMFPSKLSALKLAEYKKIGYTYKCLGSGFWALQQSDFRTALEKIVMEAGDADTNGAVAGALLGCKLGAKKLPSSWVDGLLHKEWLDKIIDRFLPLIIPSYTRQFPDEATTNDDVEVLNDSKAEEADAT